MEDYLSLILPFWVSYKVYFLYAAYSWLLLTILGIPILYVTYGFVMAAKRARDEKLSQRKVLIVDGSIAFLGVLLDAILNVVVFPILTLDFRKSTTLTLVTGRLCAYNENPNERKFRRWYADVFAAFLDGKDPSGDHVKGANFQFKWLD